MEEDGMALQPMLTIHFFPVSSCYSSPRSDPAVATTNSIKKSRPFVARGGADAPKGGRPRSPHPCRRPCAQGRSQSASSRPVYSSASTSTRSSWLRPHTRSSPSTFTATRSAISWTHLSMAYVQTIYDYESALGFALHSRPPYVC